MKEITHSETISLDRFIADKEPDYIKYAAEAVGLKLADFILGALSTGEKIIKMDDVKETTEAEFCLVNLTQTIHIFDLIRCRDCMRSKEDRIFGQWWCEGRRIDPDGFCNSAIKKGDECEE